MSEATKRKVELAIKELNYTPNQIARSLSQKKTNNIAIVAATLSSKFTTELVSAIEKIFSIRKIDVIVASTEDDASREKKHVESLKSRQVDGIIVFPTAENREYYQQLVDENYPIVFVDRMIDNLPVDSVLLDNVAAGAMATEYLLSKNHKKIAILTFPLGKKDSITTRRDRLNGYLSVLSEQNIAIEKNYIVQTDRQSISEKLDRLYQLETAPTALILTNDMLLEGALVWAKDRGIKLPGELSIVSIDDVSFAHFFTPAISTIAQPIQSIAEEVAELLYEKIENGMKNSGVKKVYPPKLNHRESVKKI
jgi:LacI family kdg operon repressor